MSLVKTRPEYVVYKMCELLNESVSHLDPLGLNSVFAGPFSAMSELGDVSSLMQLANSTVTKIGYENILALNAPEAMAATRDLAMFASCLTRWGKPVSETPFIESLLENLSLKTQEIPADTAFSYGPRNPVGPTMRKFTALPEETSFITSFTRAMHFLSLCIAGLESLKSIEGVDPSFPLIADESTANFEAMVEEMMNVREKISPEVFTNKLRPFFEPKIIGGKKYFAPGGAHMPITMIDLVLWGSEDETPMYVRYWSESVQYLPRAMRSRLGFLLKRPSLVSSLEMLGPNMPSTATQTSLKLSISALSGLFTELLKFRAVHLGVARENMKIRPEGSVGSGGYDVTILEYLMSHTQEAKHRLHTI